MTAVTVWSAGRKKALSIAPHVSFGFQASPADDVQKSDRELYKDVIEDCVLGYKLGFSTAWVLEHHFSDYFPSPNPLLFMANIAREVPDLDLGAAVVVLPWHDPLRVAEEIAMVNNFTESDLHIGLGRGTAKSEYDAFNVDMNEAKVRFAEGVQLLHKLLSGEKVSHEGPFYPLHAPVRIRPTPDMSRVHLYGAIGSPGSAPGMAKLGLPPICTANFPNRHLENILKSWREGADEVGGIEQGLVPISIRLLIADTDEEAIELGRKFYPPYFTVQQNHYAPDGNPWEGVAEYEVFSRYFDNLKKLCDPDQLGPYMKLNLIGSPETVCRRLDELIALGFNHVMLSIAIPGTPTAFRRDQMVRFAEEIAPRYVADGAPTARRTAPALAA